MLVPVFTAALPQDLKYCSIFSSRIWPRISACNISGSTSAQSRSLVPHTVFRCACKVSPLECSRVTSGPGNHLRHRCAFLPAHTCPGLQFPFPFPRLRTALPKREARGAPTWNGSNGFALSPTLTLLSPDT